MEKKLFAWKTQGMNKDLSVSAFKPEFAFENWNLRLATNEHNTTLSWVNERGTRPIDVTIRAGWLENDMNPRTYIKGTPIGTAIINSKLVLFTTTNGTSEEDLYPDSIYVLYNPSFPEDSNGIMEGVLLYAGDLNFDIEHPLETLVSYEADHIQKVYWTDGINQPRLVNIAVVELDGNDRLSQSNYNKLMRWNYDRTSHVVDTFFDFVPAIKLDEEFDVTQQVSSSGTFTSGVIQYCFTYINKYGQETNVVDTSPLFYLTLYDRGAAPNETVTCSFTIRLNKPDTTFDGVRLYSIQWSSKNEEQLVKRLETIYFEENCTSVMYEDNGTTGITIDPSRLLYVGGKEIAALTMEEKSNTLFLGNLEEKNERIDAIQDFYDTKRREGEIAIEFRNDGGAWKVFNLEEASGFYPYNPETSKSQRNITTFKEGDTYRFGFQLQKATGEWTEPIFLKDETNDVHPRTRLYDSVVCPVYAKAYIPLPDDLDTSIYKRARPVIVYPNIQDRNVLCQGVLNPTVFNAKCRKDGLFPFSQSSWFFRPYIVELDVNSGDSSIVKPNYGIEKRNRTGSDTYGTNTEGGMPYYILVGEPENTKVISDIKSKGYIVFNKMEGDALFETHIHTFEGILDLGDNVYAFISKEEWMDGNNGAFGHQYGRGTRMSGIEVYSGGLAFYIPCYPPPNNKEQVYYLPSGFSFSSTTYRPILNNSTKGLEITIPFVLSPHDDCYVISFGSTSYTIKNNSVSGTWAEFRHYIPIRAHGGAVQEGQNNEITILPLVAKGAEIMGSINEFGEWNHSGEVDGKSNTEFFVDQSIVTLHSPDIEFDTNVQLWKDDNLKLKVIGVVPITSTKSSHSIVLGSNMLETKHNDHGDSVNEDFSFGEGEWPINVNYGNINKYAGNRLIADLLWNDVVVKFDSDESPDYIVTEDSTVNYYVHPWHRDLSLNNDFARGSVSSAIKWKKEANVLFSYNTEYIENQDAILFNDIEAKTMLTENSHISNYRLKAPIKGLQEINYYPNIDTVLYNHEKYAAINDALIERAKENTPLLSSDEDYKKYLVNGIVSMKYKSTSHMVIALGAKDFAGVNKIATLPCALEELDSNDNSNNKYIGNLNASLVETDTSFWGDDLAFYQGCINTYDLFKNNEGQHVGHNFLWLGEIIKEPKNRFGGDSKEALRNNIWTVAGATVDLSELDEGLYLELDWTDGDTYYQRYDCLKTYPFTQEDPNQLVEILSFMCETHINLDGRYDKLRAADKAYDFRPDIFNLINPVYSQQNNYFFSKKLDTKDWIDGLIYPNQIWYSLPKTHGAEVDNWTNVTLASTLGLDGSKGKISRLKRFNDNLIVFQDKGIVQVLYDESMQMSTQQGVPVEIANSGKVTGYRYLSNNVGCSNKWSLISTPSGIYFMDSHNKDIYLFHGELTNISEKCGFNVWCKKKLLASEIWNPKNFDAFVTCYDGRNKEVLFISKEEALAYSEKIGYFTSFYNYGSAPYLCNLDDVSIWAKQDFDGNCRLWGHQLGDYCKFFGKNEGYYAVLVGNPNPTYDKIFTNLEFRATIDNEGYTKSDDYYPYLPFDYVKAWNEYQEGEAQLNYLNGHVANIHYEEGVASSLKRKFRIWRCDIPRDALKPLNRMRNPWVYLRLGKEAALESESLNRMELHDVIMTYFI